MSIPYGALQMGFLDGGKTMVWTGDIRYYAQKDLQTLMAAFEFLNAVREHLESQGYRVLQVGKAYDSDTHAVVKSTKAIYQRGQLSLPEYGSFDFSFWGCATEEEALEEIIANTYAPPDLPEGWSVPGIYLASRIRALVRRAYEELATVSSPVLYDEWWNRLLRLAREDNLLSRASQIHLWAPERWLEDLGYSVVRPRSWTYVPPEKRRLRTNLQDDPEALLALLQELEGKQVARRNQVLSALADLGALPPEYIPAEQAGRPRTTPRRICQGRLF